MYFWAQNLSGLQFPTKLMDDVSYDENFVVNSDASVCQPIVEKTIEAIRERLLSRYVFNFGSTILMSSISKFV